MPFGQLVIGPPGSGKTTYCNGMQQYMRLLGRKVAVVNLDPANDALPYECAIDVGELVSLEAVMERMHLGPNGGLIYCADYLEQNLDWLQERLAPFEAEGYYILFDCPGQVELFTLHSSLKNVVTTLTDCWHYRLVAVSLVDAHLCAEPGKYLAALLLSLATMLHLELPQVNLLSKVDLVEAYGRLAFNLDFYTEVGDLSRLVEAMGQSTFGRRHRKLSAGLAETVEDFGLVRFTPLAIEDKESVQRVLALADKANGAVFARMGDSGPPEDPPPELAYGAGVTDSGADDAWACYQRSAGNMGCPAGEPACRSPEKVPDAGTDLVLLLCELGVKESLPWWTVCYLVEEAPRACADDQVSAAGVASPKTVLRGNVSDAPTGSPKSSAASDADWQPTAASSTRASGDIRQSDNDSRGTRHGALSGGRHGAPPATVPTTAPRKADRGAAAAASAARRRTADYYKAVCAGLPLASNQFSALAQE
ncbi:hypothetical protein WJX81_001766 [Elliptochloris bilobata]|uniref:GPN-loop GTPase 2 n=1 Tax=Elliptochloris bilobata TaxID=381761 RepID=A0AAW1SEB6_9CHLO